MKKVEKLIVGNGLSTFIFIIFPSIYVFFIDGSITLNLFWKYEIGLIIINLITFLRLFQKGKILNKTINTITIEDENLIIKTLPFRVLKYWTLRQKMEKVKLSEVILRTHIYPLKDKDYLLIQSCFVIKIGEDSFYFLSQFFDNKLINHIKVDKKYN
ncbi:hypothetical protein [Flavobacterium ginsenosidimutans]|uniref:hypothetical protein n=1 Tax=Flavobacterium ginsenosidimutans TaxID=687844 RepID=UPI0013A615DB|nr:hypothetical protein [Flavobacterium ginsenosidimutans]KAF2338822.1 hypothetical protein DM444_00895 [Flavobacterium ginsenosidimutans]